MIVGTILVLASWVLGFAIAFILGYPLAHALIEEAQRNDRSENFRYSIWIGLLVAIIVILAIGIFVPLRSASAALLFIIPLSLCGLFTLWLYRRSGATVQKSTRKSIHWYWIFYAGICASILYLAAAALGPVTNYDSGLYHLGAIKYAGEFSTIPGLANLYFPLGYNTSLYPLGAFLGNGPWADNGYRLVNGLLISLMVLDLLIRLFSSKKGLKELSVGSFFLVVAIPISLIPLVSLSDYWVTSPSSDATVLVLTLVSVAYLLDALTSRRGFMINSAVSFCVAVIAFSLRPTMAAFLITLTIVLLIRFGRIHAKTRTPWLFGIPAALGLLLLIVQSVRDFILSGWLQYPLSIFYFNVPWLAADPTGNRQATLGNARNPADIWGSVEGFAWLGPYLSRLPSQWESYLILLLSAASVILLLMAARIGANVHWRTIAFAQVPVIASVATWFFFSPPTFRFGWGPIFSFVFIFIAFTLKAIIEVPSPLSRLNRPVTTGVRFLLPALGAGLLVIVGFNALFRFQHGAITTEQTWAVGALHINYTVAPVIEVPIKQFDLESGLTVLVPTESDQCWDNYPLCTPIVSPSVSLRGASIQQGFLP